MARQRQAVVAGIDGGRDREVAAGAFPDRGDPRRIAAPARRILQRPAIGRGRIVMLGGELELGAWRYSTETTMAFSALAIARGAAS